MRKRCLSHYTLGCSPKQRFLWKYVKKNLSVRKKWPAVRIQLIEAIEEVEAAGESDGHNPLYPAMARVFQIAAPRAYDRAVVAWRKKLTLERQRKDKLALSAILKHGRLTPSKVREMAAAVAIAERKEREKRIYKMLSPRRRAVVKRRREHRARARKEEERRMKIMEEKKKKPDVSVDDAPRVDLTRDINWVYRHLNTLIVVNDDGNKILDPDVLKKAPSNGAVAMAEFARDQPSDFFNKFLIRILAKESVGRDEDDASEKTSEEIEKELDPDFSELQDFFNTEGLE